MINKILLPFVLIAGWFLPGFAHFYFKHRYKGAIIFIIITGCMMLGLFLSDFRGIRYIDNPFYYVGQFGCGLTFLLNLMRTAGEPAGFISLRYFEVGLLFTCIGGLLNLLVLMNLYYQLVGEEPRTSL